MKKLKNRTIWLIVLALFLIAIGLIILCANTSEGINKMMIILLSIDFILLTILVQYASFRTFKYKPKKPNYTEISFVGEINLNNLIKKGYKERKRAYGRSYLKISNNYAYKIVFVDNIEKYFNQDEEENKEKPNKDLEKCNGFIGIEIFLDYDEEALTKIVEFSIQGEKVYYTALIKDNEIYKCINYIEPKFNHKNNFDIIINDLDLRQIEGELNVEN